MFRTSKNTILSIIVLLIIAAAVVSYAYSKQHLDKNPPVPRVTSTVSQSAGTSQPKWIIVQNNKLPPGMPSPLLIMSKNITAVTVDRYYSTDGVTHGEFAYTIANDPTGKENFEAVYQNEMSKEKWSITQQTATLITASMKNQQVNISFSPSGNNQTLIEITYDSQI